MVQAQMVEAMGRGGYAVGHGMHGFGFGLGFLNLIGTLLFFFFLFWVAKFVIRGIRASGSGGGPWAGRGPRGWRKFDFGRGHYGSDDALQTARDRLARSEITPKEFETIKQGLGTSQASEHSPNRFWGGDDALSTARQRFAQGELTLEEFEAVKKALQS